MDVGGQNAEVRADLDIGSHTLASIEYYHRIGSSGWFVAPRAAFDRRESYYYVAGSPQGDFDVQHAGFGFDARYIVDARQRISDWCRLRTNWRIGANRERSASESKRRGEICKTAIHPRWPG